MKKIIISENFLSFAGKPNPGSGPSNCITLRTSDLIQTWSRCDNIFTQIPHLQVPIQYMLLLKIIKESVFMEKGLTEEHFK